MASYGLAVKTSPHDIRTWATDGGEAVWAVGTRRWHLKGETVTAETSGVAMRE